MIFDSQEKEREMDGEGIQSCEFTIAPAIFLRLWYAVKAVFRRHSMGWVSGKRSSIAILSLFFLFLMAETAGAVPQPKLLIASGSFTVAGNVMTNNIAARDSNSSQASKILSHERYDYFITVGNGQLHFVQRPDLGYVVQARREEASIKALGGTLKQIGARDIRRIGGLRRKGGVSVVLDPLPIAENLSTIAALRAQNHIKYSAPLFSSNGQTVAIIPEIVVRVIPGTGQDQLEALCQPLGLNIKERLEFTDSEYLVEVLATDADNVFQAVEKLKQADIIEWAVPNVAFQPQLLGQVIPNDTYFPKQWHLNNTGQSGGTPDADIDAPEAWEITTGDPNIIVAVLDQGVDTDHPDLINNIVAGYDFYDNDNNPNPTGDDAHGTACAGLIAAKGNNGIGITGVAWNCKIMPVRIVGETGFITEADIATAIRWAANNGADIMSNSWGWIGTSSPTIYSAIIDVTSQGGIGREGKGCVVLAASGNWADGGFVVYPAKYPEVIAVGATDHRDTIWYYSGSGSELDIVAPSGDCCLLGNIWTTDITGSSGYNNRNPNILDYTDKMGGTSGACPIAAGVAALVLSIKPNLTNTDVQNILQISAVDLGASGRDNWYGYGRVDALSACVLLAPPPPASISYPSSSGNGQYTVSWASVSGINSYQLERSDNGGSNWSQVYSGSSTSYQENIIDGIYRYRVKAISPYDSSGWTTGNWDCEVFTMPAPEWISYPTSSNNGQYTVSWASVNGATWYQLERSYNGGSTWSEVYSGANASCSQKIKANGSYRYRVKGKHNTISSNWKTGEWDCAVAIESPYAGCLAGWGENSDGESDVPDGNNFTGIAAGTWHSLALKSDGRLTAWGYNDWEQCDVPEGNNFASVSAGFLYSVALKLDGSLVAWGRNSYGLLNPPSGNNYIAIAACGEHGLALKSDGSVAAWGANYAGQCDAPTEGTYTAIAAGTWHSLALKSDGTLAAWGRNYDGQCDVPDGNNYTAIAAGYNHSLALKSDGRLTAWGDNSYGECDVPDGNDFIGIAAGYEYSLALKSDGKLIAWGGDNSYGECDVPYKNYRSIAAGGYHSLGITEPISGDLDDNGQVDFRDYAIFGAAWESQPGQQNWNPACEMSEPKDNIINLPDLAEFSANWLGIE